MAHAPTSRLRADLGRWISLGVFTIVGVGALLTSPYWLPPLRNLLTASATKEPPAHEDEHAHGGSENSIQISPQASATIDLRQGKVRLSDFERSIAIPGLIVERAGRSRITITAPLTGVVTRIYPVEGATVTAGDPLFEMRLTHEELVQAQAELLKIAEEVDFFAQEVERLTAATQGGAIAGKQLLERKHDLEKQGALLQAQRQALVLHGLSVAQVDAILKTRVLLGNLVVRAPQDDEMVREASTHALLQVQTISVSLGQHVETGAPLATLTDHAQLSIQGDAFEQDAKLIADAAREGRAITANLEVQGREQEEITGLKIQRAANRIDEVTRSLHFYVPLTNELVRDTGNVDPFRFTDWKYKPGQRITLHVPVEVWRNKIVLPVGAVATEGIESYVFRVNGDHFERQPVHVEHRDWQSVVIANDGSLFVGETIAMSGAQQLQLALKNKSGGAVDPHAGHNH
jgi:multidrug efflux pump subunit AcrA (membrane-fusion protein)